VFSILSKRAAGEVATGEGLVSSYDGRGECSKMPTLREIVIFFSVDCNRSTYLYSMQKLINSLSIKTIRFVN